VEVDQLPDALRPVGLGPLLGDADVSPADQRFANDEEVRCTSTLVLVVVSGGLPWGGGGERFSHLAYALLALLIEAHLRDTLVIGASVYFQAKYLTAYFSVVDPHA
jgi:hypothetical protein